MRTMLKCALAVALMITARGLSGAARLAECQTHQANAAAPTTPDRSHKEEVIQACASDKRFMGCVLVVRGNDVRAEQLLRLREPGLRHAQHTFREVSPWIDHQAVSRAT